VLINTITVSTWEDLQEQVKKIPSKYLDSLLPQVADDGLLDRNFLYRGRRYAEWALSSTLEREVGKPDFPVFDYLESLEERLRKLKVGFPENISERSFKLEVVKKELEKKAQEKFPFNFSNEVYENMATLRHLKDPSPLLDWTRSLDIAAFFAFSKDPLGDYVSIFVFSEMPLGVGPVSTYWVGSLSLPPYLLSTAPSFGDRILRTILRHENQQAEHTLFIKLDNQEFYFDTHENLPDTGTDHSHLLWKFNIPKSEREKVMKQLQKKNISEAFLFNLPDEQDNFNRLS